ncbi:SpoIIE family protein phosphatase [Cellulomonas bogoriensis]|uniref:SpoIIE family protein phosphatase n=1 Tax=Cellulomonas bogoriensis TaxID=301388 RepID=UPI0012EC6DB6|nr:SpoIIE family protein phosphatase [Cellulomonas bogoriensis]
MRVAVSGADPAVLGLRPPLQPVGVDADGPVDVVVVALRTPQDVASVQRHHAARPEAALVVVIRAPETPGADPADLRRALSYSPGIPSDLVVLDEHDPDLAQTVQDAGDRAARRRAHAALLHTLANQPRVPGPSLRPATTALASALDHAPFGVVVLTPEGSTVSWNPRASGLLNLAARDLGSTFAALFQEPGTVHAAIQAATSADVFTPAVSAQPVRAPGTAVEINAIGSELAGGEPAVMALLVDITTRTAAERARDRLNDQLAVVLRSQEFLLKASDVLATSSGYRETLRRLATVAVPTLGDLCLIDIEEDGRFTRVAAQHADPDQQHLADVLRGQYAPDRHGKHPAARAMEDLRPHWDPHVDQDWLRASTQSGEHYRILSRLGFTGYIAVPLVVDGRALGVVTVVSCGPRRFEPADVTLAQELAGRVAAVVDKERRYDREHEIAVALQRSMLTALPELDGLEVAARYLPAHADTQVGGDWYDAFLTGDGHHAIVIGDVVGHDLDAASAMGQLRSAMRAFAWCRDDGPPGVLQALDQFNAGVGITEFTTAVYGTVRPTCDGATFEWSNAGHLAPLVVDADGRTRYLEGCRDLMIGLASTRPRAGSRTTLPPGSTLLLYTDGLVERRTHPLTQGLDVLARAVSGMAHEPLEVMCDALLEAMDLTHEDDVALLAVRVPAAPHTPSGHLGG